MNKPTERRPLDPDTLTHAQLDGDACASCGAYFWTDVPSVPSGHIVNGAQLFICSTDCDPDRLPVDLGPIDPPVPAPEVEELLLPHMERLLKLITAHEKAGDTVRANDLKDLIASSARLAREFGDQRTEAGAILLRVGYLAATNRITLAQYMEFTTRARGGALDQVADCLDEIDPPKAGETR